MGNQRVILLAVLLVVLTVTCVDGQMRTFRNRQRNKRAVMCPARRIIANGEIFQETPDGIRDNIGSVLQYTCDKYYRMEGPATRRCMPGGYWKGDETRCVPITCPKMSPFDNGNVTYSRTPIAVATIATFKCNPGTDLVPNVTHDTCMNDEKWDHNPRCRKRCDVPTTSHGEISYDDESLVQGKLLDGTDVTTACDEGYEIAGGQTSSVNTCINGYLHSPTCKEKSCPVPENPPEFTSYYPSYGTVNHGAWMYVQCYNRSYELVTVDKLQREKYHSCFDVQCDFGQFGELPFCKERSCDPSELDDHNYVPLTDSKGRPLRAIASGDKLTATCKEGFHLQDVQVEMMCDKGFLEGAIPCKPNCKRPDLDENTIEENLKESYKPGEWIRGLRCRPGYRMVGDDLHCRHGGNWAGKASCETLKGDCPMPNVENTGENTADNESPADDTASSKSSTVVPARETTKPVKPSSKKGNKISPPSGQTMIDSYIHKQSSNVETPTRTSKHAGDRSPPTPAEVLHDLIKRGRRATSEDRSSGEHSEGDDEWAS